ncbi:TIGR03086 family metal-binding protein [Streptomyces coffeae]|uniref:TIGR03086 family protein n=1 Tax=Streptomyces coffeae TaxID=621382 RepID=A0ABS1NIK3_9ACTN|nr:TIGR03086 family metal-binding protein [Streptomyces coffeae]MBL1099949.1 TIGR03086 family protein [Streptomyces coffeae]
MTHQSPIVDLGPAAQRVSALLSGVSDDQLTARTPCAEYAVGDLLDHMMGLALAFQDAARKKPPKDPERSAPGRGSAARLEPGWRAELPRRLDGMAAAWRDPAAWQGNAEAGGVTLPAEVMGLVALDELVIHGWDLARATGQPFDCDSGSAEAVIGLLSQSALEDRPKELFGPVVPVPESAPPLDRAVGLSGRDPAWSA